MKRTLYIFIFFFVVLVLTSCIQQPPIYSYDNVPHDSISITSDENTSPPSSVSTQNDEEPSSVPTLTDFEVLEVGPFHNGIARFEVESYNGNSIIFPKSQYENGKYGYINKLGEVLYAPGLQLAPEQFEYPLYTEFNIPQSSETKILYFSEHNGEFYNNFDWPENITECGTGKNGYFWIETVEQFISGNVYTMTYYHKDGTKAFTIKNAESSLYSNFNNYGYAFVWITQDNSRTLQMIDQKGTVINLSLDTNTNAFYNGTSLLRYKQEAVYNTQLEHYELTGHPPVDAGEEPYFIAVVSHSCNIKSVSNSLSFTDTIYVIVDYENLQLIPVPYKYCHFSGNIDKIDFHGIYRSGEHIIFITSDVFDVEKYSWNDTDPDDTLYFHVYDKNVSAKIFDSYRIPIFQGARTESFSISPNGLIAVHLISKDHVSFYSILDTNMNIILQPTQSIILYPNAVYADGLLPAQDHRSGYYGYLNEKGEWKIDPQFDVAENFSDGMACVNNNAFIDITGEIKFRFR